MAEAVPERVVVCRKVPAVVYYGSFGGSSLASVNCRAGEKERV
jgi:hypothetical protein